MSQETAINSKRTNPRKSPVKVPEPEAREEQREEELLEQASIPLAQNLLAEQLAEGQDDQIQDPGETGEYQEEEERKEKVTGEEMQPGEEIQAKKTFLTETHKDDKAVAQPWVLNDLLFPGGKICKLCRITDTRSRDIKVGEILTRLKLNESAPVIVLIGNEGDQRGKLLSGAVRAAYSTDAVIVDNGLKSGIESICYKRKVKLIGVCPEDMIVYPTKVSKGERLGELAAGHSHIFALGTKGDHLRWESVLGFRNDLVQRLRKGRAGPGSFNCRALGLVVGDSAQTMNEAESVLLT